MLMKPKIIWIVLAIVALIGTGTIVGKAWARDEGRQTVPQVMVLGEEDVKQLILLLDQDKNGKISKAEFIRFMEAEFDRLDKDKNGELDVRELRRSQVRVSPFASVGK